MEEMIKEFVKLSKSVQNASKSVENFWKARLAGNAPVEIDEADRAVRELGGLTGFQAATEAMRSAIAASVVETRQRVDRERALLAGSVAKKLAGQGMKVSGNLPTLFAGFFSLEFTFGSKGQCTVWMGPGKYRLGTVPLDADAIVALVCVLQDRLFPADFDEALFLADLEKACRVAALRAGIQPGKPVPLADVVPEMAFSRQKEAFRLDPRKETFTPWGRVEFAAALSRLKTRVTGDLEMRLDVATMTQTRKASDHLWVPRPGSVEGMNFSTIRFGRISS